MVTKKSIEKISENEEITKPKFVVSRIFQSSEDILFIVFSFTRGNRFDKRNRFMFYPEFQKEIPIFVAEKESVWKK